jgi:hypothetical protein
MPLYELVLDFEGESPQELRLTDRAVRVGDTVEIGAVDWVVVRALACQQCERARFQCRRAKAQSQRAAEMQEALEDVRRRAEEQRARLERSLTRSAQR